MFEKEKEDFCELATMIKALPKEERLQIQGVIIGIKLAHKTYIEDLKTSALQTMEITENEEVTK